MEGPVKMKRVKPAPWIDPKSKKQPRTYKLPDGVVDNPFYLALEMMTSKSNPRIGAVWLSLNFGGRKNKPLTKDEMKYILSSVKTALEGLKTR
jgi:hypothetical protein